MPGKNQGKVRKFDVNDKWQPCVSPKIVVGVAYSVGCGRTAP